ncbi:hypothetical protein [Streptomyces sp. PvR034]|uniref:hypothetical protein n=1 Tax=Streptomyces sp. PvR034 TaxID=3156401 RepID=UPI00339A7C5F
MPGPTEVEALLADVPGLAPYVRRATLLRPKAGRPTALDSHVGGALLWPVDEPWPVCEGPHLTEVRERLSDADRETLRQIDRAVRERRAGRPYPAYELTPEEAELQSLIMDGASTLDAVARERVRWIGVPTAPGVPLVPVLQLHARDVPPLPLPGDTDVLQVLWCPRQHEDLLGQPHYAGWGPAVQVHHRRAAPLTASSPAREHAEDPYLPRPCVLEPLEVPDLPDPEELPAELLAEVEAWAHAHDAEYGRPLSCRAGWKAGGWPSWHATDPAPIGCPDCGARSELLLTVDSGHDPGLDIAGLGEMRLFGCPVDPGHPIQLNLQ